MELLAVVILRFALLLGGGLGLMWGAEVVAHYYNTPQPGLIHSWGLVIDLYLLVLAFATFREFKK